MRSLCNNKNDSTKKNCAAGIKRDASFPDLKMAVQAFVNLVCGTSMPSKKDAMDIDQIGEKKVKKAGEKKTGGETNGEERPKMIEAV